MDKKIINYILFAVFIGFLALALVTPYAGKDILWRPESNRPVSFSGISFDVPTNISEFEVTRSTSSASEEDLIHYDIKFKYEGDDSSMRIIGDTAGQVFAGDSIPSPSKVVLKGGYEDVNNEIFNNQLKYKDYYKKFDEYKFTSTSNIRVPLTEGDDLYQFRLSYRPRVLVYGIDEKLGELSVFLTNGRVDKFADKGTDSNIHTDSFVESGLYVNMYENMDDGAVGRISTANNISTGILILSVLAAAFLIWVGRTNPLIFSGLMLLISVTFFRFLNRGLSTKGTLIVMPIVGAVGVIISKLISKKDLKLDRYDISQSLLGAVIFLFIGLLVYVVPMTW